MMNYFLIASRNLKRKGVRSLLTLLGICIGVMTIIALITLGDSLKLTVNSQFGVGSTSLITVTAGGSGFSAPGQTVVNPLTQKDLQDIEKANFVDYALGRNLETISLEFKDKLIFTTAVSIPEDYEKEFYEISDLQIDQGKFLERGDYKKIIIGNSLADVNKNGLSRQLKVGDKVIILGKEFKISGILVKKGSFTIDGVVFIYDIDLKNLKNYSDTIDIISAKVKNKEDIEKAKLDIERILRRNRNVKIGEEDFSVSTPESSLQQINQVLNGIQIFVLIIASVSIVVGIIGIVNTMTTSVLERRKEIGIMKSIGAKNSQIFYQFFIESGFLGLIGGILGVIFGIAIGYFAINIMNSFIGINSKPSLDLALIFLTLLGSFTIGSIAGILPAMKAAKQNPVQALRK